MKYIFGIFMALFLIFSGLTVRAKRIKGKIRLKYLVPAILFMIPLVALLGINVIYNTQIKPHPTTSTVLLENDSFRIGHAAKAQPNTLDEYISITASQIKWFNEHANTFWPNSSFEEAVTYFITNDKKQGWKIEYDGTYNVIIDVKFIPYFHSIIGYNTEFYPLYPDKDGEKGLVIVISEEDLLDQVALEKYTHLGMYDPLITYIHEGFHAFAQDGGHWKADASNVLREHGFDNLEARKLRTYTIELLYKAIQDESNRDSYVKQALKVYQSYKNNFPEEYQRVQYLDKIEGTAYYFEVVSCLQASYPETINQSNYIEAAALWTTNRLAQNQAGASFESYELGAVAGILLDSYYRDPYQWKKDMESDANATPMELLEVLFTEEEISLVNAPEISQEFTDILSKIIEQRLNTRNNLIDFIYHLFF